MIDYLIFVAIIVFTFLGLREIICAILEIPNKWITRFEHERLAVYAEKAFLKLRQFYESKN